MKHVKFLSDAEEEMYEAAKFYQSHAKGLGSDFLLEIESAVLSIAESPLTWPTIEGDLRRRLVRRFPFGILYYIESGDIVVVAVAHLRRKPGYWKKRV